MDGFIKQLARKAGLSEEMARDVLETAQEYLRQELPPEDYARVQETLSDKRQARRSGRLFGWLVRKVKPPER